MRLEEGVAEEEEGDFASALLLDFIPVVAQLAESDVALRLEDEVRPLHELLPDCEAHGGTHLPLTAQQALQIVLSQHNKCDPTI